MILDIRGTNGSGKSYIAHTLIKKYNSSYDGIKGGYHIPELELFICGPYLSNSGGCDRLETQDEIQSLVTKSACRYKNVFFEGILSSHIFRRWNDLAADQLLSDDYRFIFLDTPLQTCIDRVKKRRFKKGNTKPLDTYWLEYDFLRIKRVCIKLNKAGRQVFILKSNESVECILGWLNK